MNFLRLKLTILIVYIYFFMVFKIQANSRTTILTFTQQYIFFFDIRKRGYFLNKNLEYCV